MDFNQELRQYLVHQEEKIITFYEAIEILIKNPQKCVKYVVNKTFEIKNIGVLQTINSRPFYEVEIYREADVICNVNCTEPLQASYGGKLLDIPIGHILMCSAPYSRLNFQIFVNPEHPTITLSYDALLLPNVFRNRMLNMSVVKSGEEYYSQGMYMGKNVHVKET